MSQAPTAASPPAASTRQSAAADAQPWLAAVAIVPILATVYQTLVLTDVTDDVIRKGIQGEHYAMIWTNVCWGVAILYGVFGGIWSMARYGGRNTILAGLAVFLLGNVLCGAAVDVPSMAAAKLVEGIGKGMVIVLCRSVLYRQFDRQVIVAIGIYGIIAYATRPTTPLVTSLINDAWSWRWIFWINVPLAVAAFPLVLRSSGRTARRSRIPCRSTGSPSPCLRPGSFACSSRSPGTASGAAGHRPCSAPRCWPTFFCRS